MAVIKTKKPNKSKANEDSEVLTTPLDVITTQVYYQNIVIKSTAPINQELPGYDVVGRRYVEVKLSLGSPENDAWDCGLDTGCTMSLMDRNF